MKVSAIIAEYNPFHNGHLWQLQTLRERCGQENAIIIIMSGHFCQRGEPAVLSPAIRAELALKHGADLVVEMPVTGSTASAEGFARAAVRLISATAQVETLCFGTESGDVDQLRSLLRFIEPESQAYKDLLQSGLKEGRSFAEARQNAVSILCGNADLAAILEEPNQILGLEYLKQIQLLPQSWRKPQVLVLPRKGAGEHEPLPETDRFASASAIRTSFHLAAKESSFPYKRLITELSPFLPTSALAALLKQTQEGTLPSLTGLYAHCRHLLLRDSITQVESIRYMNQGLAARLKGLALEEKLFDRHSSAATEDFVERAATRVFPASRVRRALVSLLLGIRPEDELDPQYLRVLGFTRKGQYLLKRMRNEARLPVSTNFSELRCHESPDIRRAAELEFQAALLRQYCGGEQAETILAEPIRL